ncbi:fra a 1-associated protein [Phoenix dactylifera]|uniref:Fra a 1-associated protein n=1 Tax=Phoenix dactylifera TaxID=42345 RepID=A0A8B7CP93_PHODC|nr:fra a 1-associated protein [Phoenix dactylifera]
MGWKWVDDESSDSLASGRGFGEIGELVNPNSRSGEDRFSTRRVMKSSCRTEEVEPGRFVRKCEKTEQTLRDCIGRPTEVVESKTEHTEDDVTDEVTSGVVPFDSRINDLFTFPGLRGDIEAMERGLFGGLNRFLESAEEMTNEFFHSLGIPSRQGRESTFGRGKPADKQREIYPSEQPNESPYSEYAGEIRDV